jgi:hypothetical protein
MQSYRTGVSHPAVFLMISAKQFSICALRRMASSSSLVRGILGGGGDGGAGMTEAQDCEPVVPNMCAGKMTPHLSTALVRDLVCHGVLL